MTHPPAESISDSPATPQTRRGKIARLPLSIRTRLNRRLDDGDAGRTLIVWLNELPVVREVLAEHFEGREISEQNLSEWRKGGYAEWERREEMRAWVHSLAEEADELAAEDPETALTERLSGVVMMGLMHLVRAAEKGTVDRARSELLLKVTQQLYQLRRVAVEESRFELARERKEEQELEKLDAKREAMEEKADQQLRFLEAMNKIRRESNKEARKAAAAAGDAAAAQEADQQAEQISRLEQAARLLREEQAKSRSIKPGGEKSLSRMKAIRDLLDPPAVPDGGPHGAS